MSSAPIVVTQVTWQVLAWPLVALLAVACVRRRVAWLPALAVGSLLAYGAVGRLGDVDPGGATWFAAAPVLLATYPDGRFVPRWFAVPVAVSLVLAAAVALTGGAVTDAVWFAPWVGLGQLLLVAGQVHRYRRRASTAEREAVRWALLGVLVCVDAYLLLLVVGDGTIGVGGPWPVALAALAMLPAAVGPAVGLLAPRAVPVDPVLRAVLAATVAVPVLAAGYAAGSAFAGGWWGAAVVAVLAVPARRVAVGLADQLVYRGRADVAAAVTALGRRLDALPDARGVPAAVLAAVAGAVGVDGARLRAPGVLAADHGEIGPGPHTEVPVVHLGEELAVLVVPPRRGETELTGRDRAVLHHLALHSAPALHGARTLAELAAAHAATLLAREEERRRLRRDLHDDLSPSLAGLRLGAAALARRATGAADPALVRLADDLQDGITATVRQTREIAYGLRPEILDDQGLVAAITARVHGPEADGLQVVVDVPDGRGLPELPAAVDLAALRIAQEAVANVRRHAAATTCRITLAVGSADGAGHLHLTITDDGRGMPDATRAGLGLTSIRERATELGGTVVIGPGPVGSARGTRVAVRLPLTAPPDGAAPPRADEVAGGRDAGPVVAS